jgi:hypothetical protein
VPRRYTPPLNRPAPEPPPVMGYTAVCPEGACHWHAESDEAAACARSAEHRTGHFHAVKRASRYGGVYHLVGRLLPVTYRGRAPRVEQEPGPCFR